MEILTTLFSDAFMAHGYCYLWEPWLVWTNVVSDSLIGLSYLSIPITLLFIVRRRKDLPFNWMFVCFGVFIVACGGTHIMEIYTIWVPRYWLLAAMKAVTALASVPTAVLLVRLVPKAISLPSPEELKQANEALQTAHNQMEQRVRERTVELAQSNQILRVEMAERRRAEDIVRRSEARYRTLVKNAALGIFVSTANGRFAEVNPALVEMLKYESERELLSVNIPGAIYVNPEDRQRIVKQIDQEGRVVGKEVTWKSKSGKEIIVRLSARRVEVDEQHPDWTFEGIVEDMTERTQLEKQVQTLQKFEAIGRLAGGIAHDFNNVVGAVMGWAELALTDASASEEVKPKLQKICDQVQKAAALTRQLLAYARQQILERKVLDVNNLVRDVLNLLEKVIGSHIEVKAVLAPELPSVHGDSTQLEQVVVNLVLNARDAMPRGGKLRVETDEVGVDQDFCRAHPWARPGRYVRLSVSDTGEGMDAQTVEHIFEPFFTTKPVGRGSGLGLATVYGTVKQHDGFVQVYSEPGHGATFRVYLPVCSGKAEDLKPPESQALVGGTETILVADDHEGLKEVARSALERYGYTVLTASNGQEAIQVFKNSPDRIALVVMDVVMPKLTGPDAWKEIQKTGPGVAVLFSTGYSADLELLQSSTGAAVLHKPYSPNALAAKVREVLDRAKEQKT